MTSRFSSSSPTTTFAQPKTPYKYILPTLWSQLHTIWIAVDCIWNLMAHAQKPDFVFRRKRTCPFKSRGPQFSRLLAAEVYASAIVMLDTPCSEVVWKVLATHSIRQLPLHFPSRASPCAITFQLDSTRSALANSQQTRDILWIWVCDDGHCLLPVSSIMKMEKRRFQLNVGKFFSIIHDYVFRNMIFSMTS